MASSLPLIDCEVTFLSTAEGGRETGIPKLSGDIYRPHIVVGDPRQRKAKIVSRQIEIDDSRGRKVDIWAKNYIDEEMIGVAFRAGPENAVPGTSVIVTLTLMFWPAPQYEPLKEGSTFTIREGAKIVGFGRVLRYHSPETATRGGKE